MDLVKSKGMIIFLVVVLMFTIISSINTKKYDEKSKKAETSYVFINTK